jgi:hypothetical protein
LADEERERRLNYDRRKLKEHRVVESFFRAARVSYDHAKSAADDRQIQRGLAAGLLQTQKRVEQIDHWGVNSNLLPDYAELLKALSGAYPQARIAALSGDIAGLDEMRAQLDAHFERIASLLAEAAEAKDE